MMEKRKRFKYLLIAPGERETELPELKVPVCKAAFALSSNLRDSGL